MSEMIENKQQKEIGRDLEAIKEATVTKDYHLDPEMKVHLHKHDSQDEIFYCVKERGFGVLEDGEKVLKVGEAFIVHAGVMHSLRTDTDLVVTSFLVPSLSEDQK